MSHFGSIFYSSANLGCPNVLVPSEGSGTSPPSTTDLLYIYFRLPRLPRQSNSSFLLYSIWSWSVPDRLANFHYIDLYVQLGPGYIQDELPSKRQGAGYPESELNKQAPMESTMHQVYKAFGEGNDESFNDFLLYDNHEQTGNPSKSERSFGSTDSKYSLIRAGNLTMFDPHLAHGIGDANSVRSSQTDNMLNDLSIMLPATVPDVEAPSEYDHSRREFSLGRSLVKA